MHEKDRKKEEDEGEQGQTDNQRDVENKGRTLSLDLIGVDSGAVGKRIDESNERQSEICIPQFLYPRH